MISTGFGDLVDRRITKIFYDTYDQLLDVVPILFGMDNSSDQYETVSAGGLAGLLPVHGTSPIPGPEPRLRCDGDAH